MKTKQFLALLAALMMLMALLGACSNDTTGKNTDDGQTDSSQAGGEDKEDGGDTDASEDADLLTISWLGRGTTDNLRIAVEGDYANYNEVLRIMQQYGFNLDSSQADTSVYPNTINSLAAAN